MNDKIAANSPFAMFETDAELERTGIRLDYGTFYFQVARAGGGNTRFRDNFRAKMAPHQRALATETMSDDLADRISVEAFAETVILGWGHTVKKDGVDVDVPGMIVWRDGVLKAFSVEAVKELFKMLPDLARDVMAQAQKTALFRRSLAEADAGN